MAKGRGGRKREVKKPKGENKPIKTGFFAGAAGWSETARQWK